MCGIIGYEGFGRRKVLSTAIRMLEKLEYRGYDSAGLAYIDEGELVVRKKKGRILAVKELFNSTELSRKNIPRVIGHTRWATHGIPSDENSHPHTDCTGTIAVVHNGIIENYRSLRDELLEKGHTFTSETDTEVLAHLFEEALSDVSRGDMEDIKKRILSVVSKLEGSFAFLLITPAFDGIIAARRASPLVIGMGKNEVFVASDVTPLVEHTRDMLFMNDNEVALIGPKGVKLFNTAGEDLPLKTQRVNINPESAEKGGYEHFMLKEIYEQPEAIHASIRGRLRRPYLDIGGMEYFFDEHDRILMLACGTSYNASLVGKYYFEEILGIPVEVQYASEYRYGSYTRGNPLVIAVSQSGETADTLAALKECRSRGYRTLAVTNVIGSSITRYAGEYVLTQAGPEIGVAATKTFTTQVISMLLLALTIGNSSGTLDRDSEEDIVEALKTLPRLTEKVLAGADSIKEVAEFISRHENAFFIGRNINYPVALEGALKMKEISYIHAEGYPAGELKHGPLALLEDKTPVIAIVDRDHTHDKMLANVGEVLSRGSPVVILSREGDEDPDKYTDMVLRIPETTSWSSPVLYAIQLQILAYYAARERGCEIDQPRNLAKSVTVE